MMRLLALPEMHALRSLTADGRWLLLTRVVRLFAYGWLSVVLALYLAAVGLTEQVIGFMLTLTLVGDAGISLWIATMADRLGRRRMLLVGAGLMVVGGVVLGLLFTRVSPAVEVPVSVTAPTTSVLGLHRSRRVVYKLAALFMLDSFAGGLVVQSLVAYWFHVRFGVDPAVLGSIFFGAYLFAGLSALAAARCAVRFGLLNTM